MPFTQSLTRAAALVDARLEAILGGESPPLEAPAVPQRLRQAMRHAVLGGGKRFRPLLAIESAALFGVPASTAVETAAALELVHCYSLVHDDLPAMDNDALRRGQPTVWKAYDEWTAILAGDALLTLAFELLASPRAHERPEVRIALVEGLAKAAGQTGMVGGQCLDLEAEKLRRSERPGAEEIRRLQSMKTGALIIFACEAGAILGEAPAEARAALCRYGAALGLAFQIADDVLDAVGDATVVGKAVAKDAAANKATLVSLLGVDAARAVLHAAEVDAIEALEHFGWRATVLRDAAAYVARRKS